MNKYCENFNIWGFRRTATIYIFKQIIKNIKLNSFAIICKAVAQTLLWPTSESYSYRAAAARRFLAFAAPGSTERDLAANSSLLDAIEMFFRLPITWIWSSLVCEKITCKQRQK